jgi:Domain of unknown function (DUF4407)
MLSGTSATAITALGGGTFWFLCILNLDRFLLLATYEITGWKKLVPASRFLLSLCLAIVIGEHVVQFIFHKSIDNQLAQEKLDAQRDNYEKALQGFPEIAALNEEKNRQQAEIEKAKNDVAKLRADYIGEAEGTAGSRVQGKGPLYDQKERDYKLALAAKQKLDTEMQDIQNRLDAKSEQLQSVVKVANEAKDRDRGFLSYHRALFEIIRRDVTLLFLYIVISSVMILFEVTPLLSKLGGKARLHDFLAAKEIDLKKTEEDGRHEAKLRRLEDETENEMALSESIQQLKRDTLVEVAEAIRGNTRSTLSADKALLAESLMAHVSGEILARIKDKQDRKPDRPGEVVDRAFHPSDPASVTVINREREAEEPFTIVFREVREKVRGSDLMYALAGLKREWRGGTEPYIPLREYRVTNAVGESISPDMPLFPQFGGDNTVYLSLFGPTVSQQEN